MNIDTDTYLELRPYLLGVAYRMLGTWSDAEDVVQAAWLRVHVRVAEETVQHPRAWWTRVVVRLCLDARARTAAQRETYVGPWLPEPLGDAVFATVWGAAQRPAEQQTLRLALLRLMQELTPLELAAFLLRDVFDDDYAHIALTLERQEAAVRQLVRRARQHLTAQEGRFSVSQHEHEQLLYAFGAAAAAGDVEGVRQLLHEHCVARADGGGKASSATRPVLGALRVAKFYVGSARRAAPGQFPALILVNGLPALALFDGAGRCDTVLQLVIVEGAIVEVIGTRNPDKLGSVRMPG